MDKNEIVQLLNDQLEIHLHLKEIHNQMIIKDKNEIQKNDNLISFIEGLLRVINPCDQEPSEELNP